ncbi:phage major capsid protein [Jiella marina]|uniref:phage major capsid protein n=1 Tax=Jiella sp. LLJ827 TaxID=2917712 RepID=UPI00210173E2|nr:phage major capsid protein [Jiella sp. LLJ827]MCQ0987540.1 phage major capsid protein [Jiella sp. LLJ827]
MTGQRMACLMGGSMALVASHTDMFRFMPRIVFDAPDRPGGGKTAAELAVEVKRDFDAKHDKVKEIAEKALAEAEKGTPMASTAKDLADQALTGMNEAKARLDEIEQKMARGGGEDRGPRTAGERFVESDEFKTFAGQTRPRGRAIVEVKDISSLETDAAGSVGTLIRPDRAPAVELPRRRMTIRALLAPGNTTSNSIEYDKEKGFTNNAAPVAEGTLKPQSEIQYIEATASVRTIAHWMRASVQVLADVPGLRSMIDSRLRYGLAYVEEQQLLNGSGTGQNLSGLVTEATAFSAPFAPQDGQMIDTIRLGMLQTALAEYAPNGIVLNPIDWAYMETMKDANGQYLIGNPRGTLSPTLWSLPVVPTQAMGEDKFLVGAFDLAAQIFDRQDATVEVSTEDQDNFVKNKVTIRAEERLALAIYRPEALIYGDLGRVA